MYKYNESLEHPYITDKKVNNNKALTEFLGIKCEIIDKKAVITIPKKTARDEKSFVLILNYLSSCGYIMCIFDTEDDLIKFCIHRDNNYYFYFDQKLMTATELLNHDKYNIENLVCIGHNSTEHLFALREHGFDNRSISVMLI